jgi:hypothetical protein
LSAAPFDTGFAGLSGPDISLKGAWSPDSMFPGRSAADEGVTAALAKCIKILTKNNTTTANPIDPTRIMVALVKRMDLFLLRDFDSIMGIHPFIFLPR